MAKFEGYERREAKILAAIKEYGINSIDECKEICDAYGIDPYKIVEETQPICFENAKWAYTVGAAIAIKKGCTKASDAAAAIGIGLQSFCIPGSVAENRKVGLGHGNLGAMLLSEETECFCFLAGHESFAAAEGAIKIALNANKVRVKPLRVILNGLGKDAAYIISRINGFTYVETKFDPYTEEVAVLSEKAFSNGDRAKVKCYGSDSVPEGVAIMRLENVGVSITGNSTNPTRFQHPVAGTYKKWCNENGVKYFSVASGGGTGRTLHPDNMAAGPASYGMTDTLGRMHGDAQFAGSSSVPAHVEMMGLIGAGNLFAIRQNQLKRFMAFSSISQAGYIMLAVLAGTPQGMASLIYYMVVYIVANLAVFGVIASVEHHTHGKLGRTDYNGLYQTNPKLTMVMTLALFSLAGIPPFAGFFSKFFVFAAAFHSGHWLVVFIALVNTVISLYYYLLIIKAMFITPNEQPIPTFQNGSAMRVCLMVCVAGILLLGIVSSVYGILSDTAVHF